MTAPTGRQRFGAVALGGLIAALLVGVVLLGLQVRQERQEASDRAAALAAARQQAVNLTSIDHGSAAQDVDRILAGATGRLAQQFRDEKESLTAVLGRTRASSSGQVLGAGVAEHAGRSATVLVAVDAQVTSAEEPEPRLQRYRMSLDLRRVGDRWLVEEVLFAGPPA